MKFHLLEHLKVVVKHRWQTFLKGSLLQQVKMRLLFPKEPHKEG